MGLGFANALLFQYGVWLTPAATLLCLCVVWGVADPCHNLAMPMCGLAELCFFYRANVGLSGAELLQYCACVGCGGPVQLHYLAMCLLQIMPLLCFDVLMWGVSEMLQCPAC